MNRTLFHSLAALVVLAAASPAAGNVKPVAVDDSASTPEDTAVDIVVTANDYDPDGDDIALITSPIVVAPTSGSAVKVSGSTVRYTPDVGFAGTDTFQYEIGDFNGHRARAWVTVSVIGNRPPDAVDDSATVASGGTVDIVVTANDSDPDGDNVALITSPIVTPPAHGSAVKVNGSTIRYTSNAGYVGSDSFQYEIGDFNGHRDRAWVTITVTGNQAPTAVNDSARTGHDNPIRIVATANDSDPDGDAISLTGIVVAPSGGTATRIDGSTIEYRSQFSFSGTDTLTYEIADSRGATARATVSVQVVNLPACEPGGLWNELESVLITGQPAWSSCDYRKQLSGDFGNWSRGASENLPVLAAGIALHHDLWAWGGGAGGDWARWWVDYLGSQLDLVNPAPVAKLEYFKGSEMFSNNYDAITVGGVTAAHLWASKSSHPLAPTVSSYARQWLRANWYVYALAAGSRPAEGGTRIREWNEQMEPDPNRVSYYVAMSSPRSWPTLYLPTLPLFGRAAGLPVGGWQPSHEKRVLDLMQGRWTRTDVNLYGLTGAQRSAIRSLIDDEALPADLFSTFSGLRTIRDFHFLIYPNARVTVLEGSTPNRNHETTIFAARFNNVSGWAMILTPWYGDTSGAANSCQLFLADGYVEATGDFTRRMNLPGGTLLHHLVLDSSAGGLHSR